MRRRTLLYGIAALGVAGLGAMTGRAYVADLARSRALARRGSNVFESRFGPMEYAFAGDGPPVLMIHGTGGGFDQGLDMSRPLSDGGFRVLAPSRFGYLRSTFPDDPSPESQADAFVDLLDHLDIQKIPIIGGSAGALSALQFAIRHPDRCSALVALVPAAYAPGRPPVRPATAFAQAIIEHGLRSDFLFWSAMRLNRDEMISALLATDPALVRRADSREQARVHEVLERIMPVSERALGILHDGRLAGDPPPARLERIATPTLAISLDDDRFETAAAARHIAASIPGARLVVYPDGGHIWVGRNGDVFAEIRRFLTGRSFAV